VLSITGGDKNQPNSLDSAEDASDLPDSVIGAAVAEKSFGVNPAAAKELKKQKRKPTRRCRACAALLPNKRARGNLSKVNAFRYPRNC
jgi:hypothetical protein